MTVKVRKVEKVRSSFSSSGVKLAADTQLVVSQPLEIEDEFRSLYESSKGGNVVMEPPFNPVQLIALCTRNNTLQQCVHAMEVNVDGTGHTIEPIEGNTTKVSDTDPEKKKLEDFFREPYPGMSMVEMRRKLRVDLEQIGYGYLEVVKNVAGDIVMLRQLPAQTMRLVRLDSAVQVERTLTRGGKEVTVKMPVRERRFAQAIGSNIIYYKEYGASRSVDRKTGLWATDKKKVDPKNDGGEVLYFIVDRDAGTPYGVPRWINNLPSVLGSRKAEEFNLEFFDAGGIPPAIVLVMGGSMTTPVKDQLLLHLSGKNRARHRAAVVEVQSASGTLDAAGKVDVKVERFGDARQGDSLFQTYDERTELHVRLAFRIPPLFLGGSADYSYATAQTSYLVAEEQVFQPERKEFDDRLNETVVKGLGVKKFRFVSKPITLKDINTMLKGLDGSKDLIDGKEFVDQTNQITGLKMKHSPQAEAHSQTVALGVSPDVVKANSPRVGSVPAQKPVGGKTPRPGMRSPSPVKKEDLTANEIVDLAGQWSVAFGLERGELSDEDCLRVQKVVDELGPVERVFFNKILATKNFVDLTLDPDGLAELGGASADLITLH